MAQVLQKSAVNIDSGATQHSPIRRKWVVFGVFRADFQQLARVSEFGATCYNR